jgi:transmembrane sensor
MQQRVPPDDDAGPWAGGTEVPATALAEASVWVTRLHGPSRTRQMELDCLAWQAKSPANRLAFERATEVWQLVPNLPSAQAYAAVARAKRGPPAAPKGRLGWRAAALGVGALAGVAVLAVGLGVQGVLGPWWPGGEAYTTAFGEQRQVLLADGTRLWMNTETRLRVKLDAQARTVEVEAGEALFEVAHDAQRPFVVHAAASEVVALGTVFSVRLSPEAQPGPQALAVALLQGQVAVRASAGEQGLAPAAPIVMQPGQRVRLVAANGGTAPVQQLDSPHVEQLLAWRQNEAAFDDVPLAEAVAEMNRYSRTPIVLSAQAAAAGKRVSGLFRTGDNLAFASAAAKLHGLELQQKPGRLELGMRR